MTPSNSEKKPGNLLFAARPFTLRDGRAVVIRAWTEEDAKQLCDLLPQCHRESDFLAWLPGEFQMTVEQEKEFLREQMRLGSLVIGAELQGRIIASAGALKQKFRRTAHHAEFGITVLREFWGQGLGRKLTECILDWGRQQGLRKMTLRVMEDNDRAIALYRALGFVEEGRLMQDVLRGDGTYSDTIVMAIFFEKWA